MKRPAADHHKKLKKPRRCVAEEPRWPVMADEPRWPVMINGPNPPRWAHHFCSVLKPRILKLIELFGQNELKISVWSDCCGESTEMLSLEQIAEACADLHELNLAFKQYMACDNNPVCKELILQKHSPPHFSSDIFDRDFETGEYQCDLCDEKHHMPDGRLDLYVCCFPCGPWSPRGLRRGAADPNAKQCWYTMQSIKYMQPALFLCENVVGLARGQEHGDLGAIMGYFNAHVPNYHVSVVNGIDPTHFGFPQAKNRLLILGIRTDQGSGHVLEQNLAALIAEPMPITHSWRSFLGLGDGLPGLDRVGTVMKYADPGPGRCTCSVSPSRVCQVHPCHCKKCHGADPLGCGWRAKHHSFLDAHCKGWAAAYKDKVMYMQIVDADPRPGKADILTARVRNMLNILALMPNLQPLSTTYAICDISQSIDYASVRVDGVCPTAPRSAAMWSFRDACLLNGPQLAKLMGHRCADFPGCSDTNVRQILGNSVHVATAGMGLMALICSLSDDTTS